MGVRPTFCRHPERAGSPWRIWRAPIAHFGAAREILRQTHAWLRM